MAITIVSLGAAWVEGQDRVFDRYAWRTVGDSEGNEFDVIVDG